MITPMTIQSLAQQLAPHLGAVASDSCPPFTRVCTDTRALQKGDFFIALRGPNFDGHQFLAAAQQAGAAGALVDSIDVSCSLPQLQVDDTVLGLGEMARLNRLLFAGPVIGITGSSGKTSVRTMVDAILRREGEVLTTEGNLNNHIGVPLTLLKLTGAERHAVIEMGASGIGEIAYLCELALPDVVLINNVMAAHLEGFGSLEGVAEAKGEIYQGVKDGGCCVVNLDDKFSAQWLHEIHRHKKLTFALHNTRADCYISERAVEHQTQSFVMHMAGRRLPIQLNVAGEHNVRNAMAAACCAYAVGASDASIVEGLADFVPVAGRMKRYSGPAGSTLIDDAYNANPGSVRAAIDVLSSEPGKTILVMGDMGELGEEAEFLHGDIGRYAAEKKLHAVYTVGALARSVSDNFNAQARHFDDQQALIDYLHAVITDSNCTLLIKGSRSARMDRVVSALTYNEEAS